MTGLSKPTDPKIAKRLNIFTAVCFMSGLLLGASAVAFVGWIAKLILK